ncbi:MAG: TRAP transporter small permease [Proteobacteria bacterium]|nr:TRAP transporter small permease [Pseudomonadota bacterium]
MERLWRGASVAALWGAWAGGSMILLASIVVTVEVVSRKLLAFAFSGSDEIAAYLFAVGTSWSLAHVLVTRGHVRIDVLYGALGARSKAAFDLVAIVGLAVLVVAIFDSAGKIFLDNLASETRSNTPLRIPLAWPQAPWFAGFALFLIATLLAFLRSVRALVRGDLATVSATIGVPSQDEEVKGELGALGIDTPNAQEKR